jgi:two-component system nitrogen regulation sensor histidine kinase NtrY
VLTGLSPGTPDFWGRVRRLDLERRLALLLSVGAVVAGIATWLEIQAAPPYGAGIRRVTLLLQLDLVLLLLLGLVIGRRLVRLFLERRRGLGGSRLHGRLVMLFALVALTPTLIVSIFSVGFLASGLEAWFSGRIHTALENSLRVARAYLEEHKTNIRADALAMAADLNRDLPFYFDDPLRLQQVLDAQAALRSLGEAVIFDASGEVVARSGLSFTLEISRIPLALLDRADRGEVVVLTSDTDDRVRALLRLEGLGSLYLVVGRFVDPQVLDFVDRTQEVVGEYEAMQSERSQIQITSALIFATVALLLLLSAIWTGLNVADRLAAPLYRLIAAAERVSAGDLMARVPETDADDEIASLSRTFNRMTGQLAAQQRALVDANQQLDLRRRFTEAVLEGVSAGVLGLDAERRILLPNGRAEAFFGGLGKGRPVGELFPEILPLFDELRDVDRVERQIAVERDGRHHVLLVRLAVQREEDRIVGFVVTFDDITELITAQRQAAWAEVARRIAHEIKNPLTPIRLSAERLARKYGRHVPEDEREAFTNAIATITRQVDIIGRMVAEFSAFARMPAPVMRRESLAALVREAVLLQQHAWPDVRFEIDLPPDDPLEVICDGEKIGQALTNLLKNAAEALAEHPPAGGGEVRVSVHDAEGWWVVEIADNGPGLPEGERHRLFEPYVTTKRRGSGLGLAIVRKIMEEHQGRVEVTNGPQGGTLARLLLPRRTVAPGPAAAANPSDVR